ncbi:MAG: GNAT family N-acetyltransferase [Promethearchaeota archaeon]
MNWFRNLFQRISNKVREGFQGDLNYIQMRLPVNKITKDFEESLKNKIKNKVKLVKIRKAVEEDIEDLIIMHEQAWQSTPMPYHQISKDKLFEIFKDPDITILIAEENSIDIGFIILYFTGENNIIGVIAGLGILPEYQHKGLGTFLGIASWNYFKEKGVRELRCKVFKDNKISYTFIKKLGFEEYNLDFPTWKF